MSTHYNVQLTIQEVKNETVRSNTGYRSPEVKPEEVRTVLELLRINVSGETLSGAINTASLHLGIYAGGNQKDE